MAAQGVRKTEAPPDPSQLLGGKPVISINANKLQINEFLKLHKKTLGIKPTEGGKRKSLIQLREELKEGGHFVGVESSSSNNKSEEEYKTLLEKNPQGFNVKNTNMIKIAGFSSEAGPVSYSKPTKEQVFMSGHTGLPALSPVVSLPSAPLTAETPKASVEAPPPTGADDEGVKKKKLTKSAMINMLAQNIPTEQLRGLDFQEVRVMFDSIKYPGYDRQVPDSDISKGKSVAEMRQYLDDAELLDPEEFMKLGKVALRRLYEQEIINAPADYDEEEDDELIDEVAAKAADETNEGERVFPDGGSVEYNGETFRKFYWGGETYFMKGDYDVHAPGGLGDDLMGIWGDDGYGVGIVELEDVWTTSGNLEPVIDGVRYEDFVLHPRYGDDTTYWVGAPEDSAEYVRGAPQKIYDKPGGTHIATLPESPTEVSEIDDAARSLKIL